MKATFLKRFSAAPLALSLFGLGGSEARAQDTTSLARVNQDELASFYGRMNVVVGSGARAFGMGGAFLARADDATAASWNPAGLSYLRRKEFSLVGVHNDFSQRIPREFGENLGDPARPVTTPVTTVDRLNGAVADFAGIAHPLRIRGRAAAVQASYQRSFSFTGSRRSEGPVGVKGFVGYDPSLPGCEAPGPTCVGQRVQPTEFTVEGNGGFDTLSLSSGVEIHPRVRLGVSLNRWINGFSQVVDRPNAQTGGYRRISSTWDISGTNFNLGALLTPTSRLNLGLVYKTPFTADVRLSKIREDLPTRVDGDTGLNAEPEVFRHDGDVQISFPRVYGFGASYRASNTLTFSADFTRTAWSQATITDFFSLGREVPSGPNAPPPFFVVDTYDARPFPAVEVPSPAEGVFRQVDTNQIRVGAEWVLRLGESGTFLLPLRAGFFRDGQTVTVKLQEKNHVEGFPVVETHPIFSGFTAGFGLTAGGVLFDVAFIREGGNVIGSRSQDGLYDAQDDGRMRVIRYNRVFASMMVRFGRRQ